MPTAGGSPGRGRHWGPSDPVAEVVTILLNAILLIVAAVWVVGFGIEAARLASDRRRSPLRWFVYGGVLGPLGLRILRMAPPGICNTCLSPVAGWSIWCRYCGLDTRENWDMPAAYRARLPQRDTPATRGATTGHATPVASPHAAGTTAAGARGRRSTGSSAAGATGGIAARGRPRHLVSAVFVDGSEPLERGTRYQLVIDGDDLSIVGAGGSRAGRRVLSRRLREVQVTSAAERLLIAGTSDRTAELRLVFSEVRNDPATGLLQDPAAPSPALELDASGVRQ